MERTQDFSIAQLCYSKVEGLFVRLIDVVRLIPLRLRRIGRHIWVRIGLLLDRPVAIFNLKEGFLWFVELIFLLLDLLGVGEIYETLSDLVKFNTRPLSEHERSTLDGIFGESLNVRRIRIDECAFLGPYAFQFAYVGCYTINCWGDLPKAIFVHELVHIWQYQHIGSVYIPRALRAQFSEEGYNYGGMTGLLQALRQGRRFSQFNLEQQGDIVSDYYRLSNGKQPRWASHSPIHLHVYEDLLGEIKEKRA